MDFSTLTYYILLKSARGFQFLETLLGRLQICKHVETLINVKALLSKARLLKICTDTFLIFFFSFNCMKL